MHKKHGMTGTRIYRIWKSMRDRVELKTHVNHHYYKNLTICSRWKEFENFKEDMYEMYKQHVKQYGERNTTLDRIEGMKGYSPQNCRWTTWKEQSRNRPNIIKVQWQGEERYIEDLAQEYGLTHNVLLYRIKKGWTIERALTEKIRK